MRLRFFEKNISVYKTMNNVLYLYLIIYKDLWTSILIVTLILKKRCICDFSCNRMIVLTTKGVCL